jgi:hypothetical protein
MQKKLLLGDESILEEETAAGDEGPTSSDSGVFSFDARDGGSTDINSSILRSDPFGSGDTDLNNTEGFYSYDTTVSLNGTDVNEDEESAIFTLNFTSPTLSVTTITVDAGGEIYTFTAPAGSTTFNFSIPTQDSDVYIDPETLTVTIVSITGGGFDNVDLTNATTTINITDTIDTTTVSISGTDVNEDEASATFTVTLSNPTDVSSPATVVVNVGGTYCKYSR